MILFFEQKKFETLNGSSVKWWLNRVITAVESGSTRLKRTNEPWPRNISTLKY